MQIDLTQLQKCTMPYGVETEIAFEGTPDEQGVLRQYLVRLPHFERASYYAAYQRHDPLAPGKEDWVEGANRVQPLAVRDLSEVRDGGLFALVDTGTGCYIAFLPLVGKQTAAWFSSELGDLTLNVGTLGIGPVKGNLPLLAWACADDPYQACYDVWEAAIDHLGATTRLREEKVYPEIFRYLGWCSWEEYRANISAEVLIHAVKQIEASGLPIRYMLVDDGHIDHVNRQLVSFAPNSKLPEGWEPLLSLRKEDKIRWMGVWLNHNGYWNGVSQINDLGPLNTHLTADAAVQALLPRLGPLASIAFYNGMISTARQAGFDFVKVDNQAANWQKYRGMEQPVIAAAENSRALEQVCAFHMDGLINCMAHGAVALFNTRISAVTRCSEDYRLGDMHRARCHLHNSYGNMLWLGPTVWGDHDMFHSNDPASGRMMAVSKALSGGPIYLSDAPDAFIPEIIIPLCYEDGELLRPLAPAAPLPDSMFIDPFEQAIAYRVAAPLVNGAMAIAMYNFSDPVVPVEASITPEDYVHAGGMLQPPQTWALPDEGLVLYDVYASRAEKLDVAYDFVISGFDDRLFMLCPVKKGWAVIGLTNKFLAPAGVDIIARDAKRLLLRTQGRGPVSVWCASPVVRSKGVTLTESQRHVWTTEVVSAGTLLEFTRV